MTCSIDLWSAIGQWVAAFAAIFGLGFIGYQIRIAGRAADLTALQTFFLDAKAHEDALTTATDKSKAFVEYLNFLEVYATAFNSALLPKATRPMVQHKIIDALVIISVAEQWHENLTKAINSPETFTALTAFYKKHKTCIHQQLEAKKQVPCR